MKLHNKISVVISTCLLSGALFGLTFAVASETPKQETSNDIVLKDDGRMVSYVDLATHSSRMLGTVEDLKVRTGIDLSAPGITLVTIARNEASPRLMEYLNRDRVEVGDSAENNVGVGWKGR